jgi:hypothetical protein
MNWQTLLSLFKDAFPLPDFTSSKAIGAWIAEMSDEIGEVIAELASGFAKTGSIEIELPSGDVVSCFKGADGEPCMTAEDSDKLCAAGPEAWGDGTLLKILAQLLPIILKILPFFLKKDPDPTPPPPVV